jgi:hypothetical protein
MPCRACPCLSPTEAPGPARVAAQKKPPDPLAREDAADETGLPLATFPEVCPWTPAQVLDVDFWPEGEPTP